MKVVPTWKKFEKRCIRQNKTEWTRHSHCTKHFQHHHRRK